MSRSGDPGLCFYVKNYPRRFGCNGIFNPLIVYVQGLLNKEHPKQIK